MPVRRKLQTARAALANATKKTEVHNEKHGTNCVWLIEPRGAHTNEILSKTENVTEEGLLRCSDGEEHFLFRMPNHAAVANFRRSEGRHLLFNVFRRIGMGKPELAKNWMTGTHKSVPLPKAA